MLNYYLTIYYIKGDGVLGNFFTKYAKYVVLLIFIFEIIYFGIPDYIKPIFVYQYLIFFGLCYLLGILHDFFNASKKTDTFLRVTIIISALVLLITSIYYKATLSIISSVIMLVASSFSYYLENKKNKQKN